MNVDLSPKTWRKQDCAFFMRSRDAHGQLSNMTFGYPLRVNGLELQGPEGLYQALKFPHKQGIQREIARQRSGMEAKRVAYTHPREFNPVWDQVKLDAMALTLTVKLFQHPGKFGAALDETRDQDIVEMSNRDPWWGAKAQGDTLTGVNALGKLLTMLRDFRADACGEDQAAIAEFLREADLSQLMILGRPLQARRPEGE